MSRFTLGGGVANHRLRTRKSKWDDLIEAAAKLNHKQTIVWGSTKRRAEADRLCIRKAFQRFMPDSVRDKKRFEVRLTKGTQRHPLVKNVLIICFLRSRER